MGIIENKIKKTIQSMATDVEGANETVTLESLLTGLRVNPTIGGIANNYREYGSQVTETYKKYNGNSEWGNQQTRAVIDFRSAFIAGEGLSISCEDEKTVNWINDFLKLNNLNGSSFINSVKSTEMTGQTIYQLKTVKDKEGEPYIKVIRKPIDINNPYMPTLMEAGNVFSAIFKIKENNKLQLMQLKDSVPVITGGDDIISYGPTTKVGIVLNDLENYDRAVKDMRRLNHILARITPTVKTNSQKETNAIMNFLNQTRWKIGQMFIGTGEFKYEVPSSGAHENLVKEITTTVKNISAVTGIPVHWLGHVDMMSNRSTAESLYEVIKNSTINERTIHAEAIYRLIVKAQELYIDNGGEKINRINKDIEVKIPLLDFHTFYDRVRALSVAFNDGVIATSDYQNQIPGINPLETKKKIEREREDDIKKFMEDDEEEI